MISFASDVTQNGRAESVPMLVKRFWILESIRIRGLKVLREVLALRVCYRLFGRASRLVDRY